MLANSQFIIYNQVSMSIPNIFHKIKYNSGIDKVTILYLFIIVGVGIGSFSLGRLSISNNYVNKDSDILITEDNLEIDFKEKTIIDNGNNSESSLPIKRYVASKNGKMYYSLGCSGAKRIKPENEIWFNTEEDAKKSGYTKSTTCK
jgi:hypothetical protein